MQTSWLLLYYFRSFYAVFPFLDFVRSGTLDISLSFLRFGTVLQLTFDSQDGPYWGWYRKLSLQTRKNWL